MLTENILLSSVIAYFFAKVKNLFHNLRSNIISYVMQSQLQE